VKILAINRAVLQGRPDRDRNVVTLELTPEQANVLNVAGQRGLLSLSFNPQGKGTGGVANRITNREKVTIEQILDLPPIPVPEEPVPLTSYYVEQWRGAAMTLREFGAHNRGGVRDSSVQPRRRNNPAAANTPAASNPVTDPAAPGLDPVPAPTVNDPTAASPDLPPTTDLPTASAPPAAIGPNSTATGSPGAAPATAVPAPASNPVTVPTPSNLPFPNATPNQYGTPIQNMAPTPLTPQSLLQPPGGLPGLSPVPSPRNPPAVPGPVVNGPAT
jgi:hypothetical protein